MMIPTILLSVAVVLSGGQTAAPVNFSGIWSPVKPTAAASATAGTAALPPSDITIRQTANAIEIDRTAFERVTTLKYTLDGKPSTNKPGATTAVTSTRWEGKKLVTTGKVSQVTSQGYDEWTIREVRSLNAAGAMVLESSYTGTDGKTVTNTTTYTRHKLES